MCGGHDGGAVDFIWLAWRLVCAVLKMFLRGASHRPCGRIRPGPTSPHGPAEKRDGDVGGMWHMMIDVHVAYGFISVIAFSAGRSLNLGKTWDLNKIIIKWEVPSAKPNTAT